jgi:hypothetical protein
LPHLLATILEKTPRCVAWFIAHKVTRANKNANYYPRPAVLGKGASLASARALSPHSGDATMDGIVIIAFTAFLMILALLCWEQIRHEQHRKDLEDEKADTRTVTNPDAHTDPDTNSDRDTAGR